MHSDVDELDRLLHPDLVFVGPDGAVHMKVDDLEWHRTGVLHVGSVDHENLIVRVNDGVGNVTVFTATMVGELAASPFSSRMRYAGVGMERWPVAHRRCPCQRECAVSGP